LADGDNFGLRSTLVKVACNPYFASRGFGGNNYIQGYIVIIIITTFGSFRP